MTTPTPRKGALQLVFGLVAIAVSGRSAAVEVVLVDRTSQATVAMADYPGDRSGNTVVVAWDNAPGDLPTGAMMFRRERTEFERAGQIALAKQTVGLLEATASSCSDCDYKDAISKLRGLHIGYRADGALDLATKGSDVVASISPKSFNPRETALRWIKDNL